MQITISWAIWDFLRGHGETAGEAGAEVVEEQAAAEVQAISRAASLTRLPGNLETIPEEVEIDLNRAAEIENSILQEESVNPGVLTEAELAEIEELYVSIPLCVIADEFLNFLDRYTSTRASAWGLTSNWRPTYC